MGVGTQTSEQGCFLDAAAFVRGETTTPWQVLAPWQKQLTEFNCCSWNQLPPQVL